MLRCQVFAAKGANLEKHFNESAAQERSHSPGSLIPLVPSEMTKVSCYKRVTSLADQRRETPDNTENICKGITSR